jgi:hypothetical protein
MLYDSPQRRWGDGVEALNRQRALDAGWTFESEHASLIRDGSRATAWSKVLLLQRALREARADWVIWLDADAVLQAAAAPRVPRPRFAANEEHARRRAIRRARRRAEAAAEQAEAARQRAQPREAAAAAAAAHELGEEDDDDDADDDRAALPPPAVRRQRRMPRPSRCFPSLPACVAAAGASAGAAQGGKGGVAGSSDSGSSAGISGGAAAGIAVGCIAGAAAADAPVISSPLLPPPGNEVQRSLP